MRIAILDPAAGLSGDMLLGALVDVGVGREWLESLPARLGFRDVRVHIRTVMRAGVRATKVDFDIPPGIAIGRSHHGAHVGNLVALIKKAGLAPDVEQRAIRAFELIGTAEGRVHGVAPDRVHLHEVGAVDAVLDIVGTMEGFTHLGADQVYNLPVAIGSGWVASEHGNLPVPAPATAILLEGCEIASGGSVEGEATTPTGAALLRVLSAGPPPGRWRMIKSGWGAGTREPAHYANALRVILAESAAEAGEVEVIATDLDDLEPEYVEPLREAVFAAGALDCVVWTGQGKKGRVSLRVEALAPVAAAEAVVQALFANSTTAGVRRWRAVRNTLARREVTVRMAPDMDIRIKVLEAPGGLRIKPEYQDVVRAAERLNKPALSVAREAARLADAAIKDGAK